MKRHKAHEMLEPMLLENRTDRPRTGKVLQSEFLSQPGISDERAKAILKQALGL